MKEHPNEDGGEDDEGTHGWLNPSLERPSRRQGAHTFPSFSLKQKKDCSMQEAGVRSGYAGVQKPTGRGLSW